MTLLPKGIFRFSLFIFFSFVPVNTTAQNRFRDDLSVSLNYHYGFVVPEYSNLLYLVEDNVQSVSLNFAKKTRGKNDWEHLYNYPEYGISLFFSSLGNNTVHGHEVALFPYFNLNIL